MVIEAKQASVSCCKEGLSWLLKSCKNSRPTRRFGIVGGFGLETGEVKMTMSEWFEFIGEENGSDDLIIEDEELNEDF